MPLTIPSKTRNKSHDTHSVQYDAAFTLQFGNFASPGNGIVSTTVQAQNLLGYSVKILAVKVNADAVVATFAFNVVAGLVAETGVSPLNDAIATAGQSIFAADQAVAVQAANATQTFVPDQPDAIWVGGTRLTLRFVTGTPGAATNIAVALLCKTWDNKGPISVPINFATDLA
jgi:hypothetical protein